MSDALDWLWRGGGGAPPGLLAQSGGMTGQQPIGGLLAAPNMASALQRFPPIPAYPLIPLDMSRLEELRQQLLAQLAEGMAAHAEGVRQSALRLSGGA